jgi:hypothetical protein
MQPQENENVQRKFSWSLEPGEQFGGNLPPCLLAARYDNQEIAHPSQSNGKGNAARFVLVLFYLRKAF